MIILGIDPGLANTGWGVVETRGSLVRARAYGCIASSADEPIDMRLGRIFREISRKIRPRRISMGSSAELAMHP